MSYSTIITIGGQYYRSDYETADHASAAARACGYDDITASPCAAIWTGPTDEIPDLDRDAQAGDVVAIAEQERERISRVVEESAARGMRPLYCTRVHAVSTCAECSLSSYGHDCHNNAITTDMFEEFN